MSHKQLDGLHPIEIHMSNARDYACATFGVPQPSGGHG